MCVGITDGNYGVIGPSGNHGKGQNGYTFIGWWLLFVFVVTDELLGRDNCLDGVI